MGKNTKRICTMVLLFGIMFLLGFYVSRAKEVHAVYTAGEESVLPVVVLDAGHGGKDPGKVGVNGALEKEINLQIVFRLKRLLEQNDVLVVLTRDEDKDLASDNATHRKSEDLRERVRIVEEIRPALLISIHQNSYTEEDVDGAQVFYYKGSEQGKRLGGMVQESLRSEIKDGNHRMAKASRDEYYLLKEVTCPAIMVECGFLSNKREADLLAGDAYQEKVAYAIMLGIMEYIHTEDN